MIYFFNAMQDLIHLKKTNKMVDNLQYLLITGAKEKVKWFVLKRHVVLISHNQTTKMKMKYKQIDLLEFPMVSVIFRFS